MYVNVEQEFQIAENFYENASGKFLVNISGYRY
jgi:hypothetical protein